MRGGGFCDETGGGFYFHGLRKEAGTFFTELRYITCRVFVSSTSRGGRKGGRRGEKRSQGHAFLGRQDVEGHLGPPSPLPCSVYGPIALLTVVAFYFLADSRRCDY